MFTTLTDYLGKEFEIYVTWMHQFKGRGGWNVIASVSYNDEQKDFRHYMTDSMFIDEISELKAEDTSLEDIQQRYTDMYLSELSEEILEWCEEINETKEDIA